MKQLTKKQQIKRDNYFQKMIESGELTQSDIDRIMSNPIKRSAINALCALRN